MPCAQSDALEHPLSIVLDTNIILSGLLYGGAPSTLIRLGQTGKIELFTSLFILEELSRILLRSKFDKRIHESGLSVAELVGTFARTAILVEPQPIPRTAPDPDDDIILATAIAAHADSLITGDKPLLSLGSHAGFEIVSVHQFLARFSAAPAR